MLKVRRTPKTGGEKETLRAILHNQRAIMVWKLEGLDQGAARKAVVPSGTSLLGMISHLTRVELWWFGDVIAGGDYQLGDELAQWKSEVDAAWKGGDGDFEFRIDPADTIEKVVARYEEAVAVANEIIERYPLEHISPGRWKRSLRWVLLHMIEETARHAGHADLARELIDGTTGYVPG